MILNISWHTVLDVNHWNKQKDTFFKCSLIYSIFEWNCSVTQQHYRGGRIYFFCYLVILRQMICILQVWEVIAQFSILFSSEKHSLPSAASRLLCCVSLVPNTKYQLVCVTLSLTIPPKCDWWRLRQSLFRCRQIH